MYILSQISVVLSDALFASTYIVKKKNILLILNVLNNFFFGIHFLLLKSITAAYSVFLTIVFLIAIYLLERFKQEKFSFIISILCSICLIVITIFTWDGALALLPVIGIFLVFVGTLFKNTLLVKCFYFISTVLNTIYMFFIHSYFGFALNLVILAIAIFGIINHIRTQNKKV
ncbi:MAG: YgjV family protein [Clostridia bacterium]|nr:YgjV family protein [Clostridia bacterium]